LSGTALGSFWGEGLDKPPGKSVKGVGGKGRLKPAIGTRPQEGRFENRGGVWSENNFGGGKKDANSVFSEDRGPSNRMRRGKFFGGACQLGADQGAGGERGEKRSAKGVWGRKEKAGRRVCGVRLINNAKRKCWGGRGQREQGFEATSLCPKRGGPELVEGTKLIKKKQHGRRVLPAKKGGEPPKKPKGEHG